MPPGRDQGDAMAALERLFRHQVITLDQAKLAARTITGDESIVFPPPAPAAEPAPAPAAAPAPAPAAEPAPAQVTEPPPATPTPSTEADKTPDPGSETP